MAETLVNDPGSGVLLSLAFARYLVSVIYPGMASSLINRLCVRLVRTLNHRAGAPALWLDLPVYPGFLRHFYKNYLIRHLWIYPLPCEATDAMIKTIGAMVLLTLGLAHIYSTKRILGYICRQQFIDYF